MPDVSDRDPADRGTGRASRSARRIVAAVAAAVVTLVVLAAWVLAAPYRVEAGGSSYDCDAHPTFLGGGAGARAQAAWDRRCDDARDDRRNVALLLGAGVAIAACAVSTVPSRRLTGEALGPRR